MGQGGIGGFSMPPRYLRELELSRMVRAFSLLAMGGGFLYFSPPFRLSVFDVVRSGVRVLDNASPYSYIGLGVCLVICFLLSVSRGSGLR